MTSGSKVRVPGTQPARTVGTQTKQPFTRLPVTDIVSAAAALSDVYDKLASLQTPAVEAVAQGSVPRLKHTPPDPSANPSIRIVQTSTQLLPSDSTIVTVLENDIVIVLPDAASCPGKIYYLKNDAASDADFVLGVYNQHQQVDRQDPGNYTVIPEHAIIVQSDGQGWIVLATYL